MVDWDIVEGDYGGSYKAVVEGQDLSACTAKIKVWGEDDSLLIDGKDCSVVTYDSGEDESFCYYDVEDGDFPLGSAINDDVTTYNAMIEFTKSGYKEHDLGFKWVVHRAPP